MYNRRFLAVCLALVVFVAILAVLAHLNRTLPGDVALARAWQSVDGASLMAVMALASAGGDGLGPFAIVLAGAAAVLALRRPLGASFVLFTAAGDGVFGLVKLLVNRPRPSSDLVRVAHAGVESSFPSGHVVHYTVVFGFLWYLAFVSLRRSRWRSPLLILLALPIVLVGPSRVYLGMHWPSDVFGGYLIGGLVLLALIWLFQLAQRRWPPQRTRSAPFVESGQSGFSPPLLDD